MRIEVELRKQYGLNRLFPTTEEAQAAWMVLTGGKTVTESQIAAIRLLGGDVALVKVEGKTIAEKE